MCNAYHRLLKYNKSLCNVTLYTIQPAALPLSFELLMVRTTQHSLPMVQIVLEISLVDLPLPRVEYPLSVFCTSHPCTLVHASAYFLWVMHRNANKCHAVVGKACQDWRISSIGFAAILSKLALYRPRGKRTWHGTLKSHAEFVNKLLGRFHAEIHSLNLFNG